MSTRISCANSGWTTAATWKVASAVSGTELDSDAASVTISTGNSDSGTFVPAATAIDAVAIKIYTTTNPTGTLSVSLRNSTAGTNTTVTINASDLNASARGWHVFSFGAVTPNGTDTYLIRVTRSVADSATNRISIYCSTAAASNMSRQVRLTTTGAPGAGDKLIVAGEFTGQGTSTAYTVTMDETANTSYGPTVVGGPPQGITVCDKSTLNYGYASTVNYYLRVKGVMYVYPGGTFTIGTAAHPIPSDGSAVLEFASVTTVDSGLKVGGTFYTYGNALTYDRANLAVDTGGICSTAATVVTRIEGQTFTGMSGNIIINGTTYTIASVTSNSRLVLTSSAGTQTAKAYVLANTTTMTTDVSTGWLSGDIIGLASTGQYVATQTQLECEQRTLSGDAVGTTITVSSALTYGRMGTTPTIAEIVNLTRNVKIRGITNALYGYIFIDTMASGSMYWTELYQIGSIGAGFSGRYGVQIGVTNNSFEVQRCALRDSPNGYGLLATGPNCDNITLSNNVFYNLLLPAYVLEATTGSVTIDNNLSIKSNYGYYSYDNDMIFTNNTVVGTVDLPIAYNEKGKVLGTFSGNKVHSCNFGLNFKFLLGGTVSDFTAYRNYYGIYINTGQQNVTYTNITLFGNVVGLYLNQTLTNCIFDNITINAGSPSYPTNYGLANVVACPGTVISNSSIGVTTPHTADMYGQATNSNSLIFQNCTFSGGTPNILTNYNQGDSYFAFERLNGIEGNNKTYFGIGTRSLDTTAGMWRTASPSERLTTSVVDTSLKSSIKSVSVKKNATVTVSVWVRESVVGDGTDYNGGRCKLWVKANAALGINSDTLLDTATASSEGAFQKLTGTTTAAVEDGALSFYVTCGNASVTPTGWVNIDDWATTSRNNDGTQQFWKDGNCGGGLVSFANSASSSVM